MNEEIRERVDKPEILRSNYREQQYEERHDEAV